MRVAPAGPVTKGREWKTSGSLLILFALAALAAISKSEAVLPAYLLGMTLATFFIKVPTSFTKHPAMMILPISVWLKPVSTMTA